MDYGEAKPRQRSKTERHLFHRSWRWRVSTGTFERKKDVEDTFSGDQSGVWISTISSTSSKRMGRSGSQSKISLCGELELRNRLFQENHARDCQEIEELRRICLRRNRSSKTSKNWWIVFASKEESYDSESSVDSNRKNENSKKNKNKKRQKSKKEKWKRGLQWVPPETDQIRKKGSKNNPEPWRSHSALQASYLLRRFRSSKTWKNRCIVESIVDSDSGITEQSKYLVRRQRFCTILNQGAALGRPTSLSPGTLPRCDSGLPRDTQNGMGTRGNVFERPLAQEGPSSTFSTL